MPDHPSNAHTDPSKGRLPTKRDGGIVRPDGRTVAWVETGALDGRPLLWLPGTPASRLWFRTDQTPWVERRLRVIVTERPGFGASTGHPGRTFFDHADDLAAILDTLAIARLPVLGISGASPYVLALSERHSDRVTAAAIVVGATPFDETEASQLIGLNAESNRLAWVGDHDGMAQLLAPVREALLTDPLASFREIMRTAPPADQEIMRDPSWQRTFVRGLTEALRPGVEGWVDESVLLVRGWDNLEVGAVRTDVTWWHGDHDRSAPLSAVERVVAEMPHARLNIFPNAGHLTPYRQEGDILDELLARAQLQDAEP
jgi:pimeloyl-ACP methyl ester carboxylesterase